MKKTSILLSLFFSLTVALKAQTRMALYEEFTGENCPPCASTNPGLDALLAQPTNTAKTVPIKWQVAIPSAPSATWSLYQTNKIEIDWRRSYYTVNSAPDGRMDGQNVTVFGASSNHPGNLQSTHIANAQAITTPFSINVASSWDANFNNAVVTITITSSATFNANGALKLRLVLVEREIDFATAPGTNGEKHFADVVRKSFPDIQNGTTLPSSWTAAQTQTYSINCATPSYIVNKAEMAFVGFIQDDGNKLIWQAGRSNQAAIPNDIKLASISAPSYSCANSINPSINVTNQGTTAITAMTIVPTIDAVAQNAIVWTGNLAGLASTVIPMNTYTASSGSHNLSINITNVSGGDVNTNNNSKSSNFALIQTYFPAPLVQGFTAATFPPSNWFTINTDLGASWSRSSTGLNGAGSAKYDFYNNSVIGDEDELFLIPSDLTGMPVPMLSFDVAYAQYQTEDDALDVEVSTDCGATWTNIFSKSGSVLSTAPAVTSAFTPSGTQWRNETAALPSGAANNANVLVKFVATSDYGNNLYIDNINIANNITSIKTNNAAQVSVILYPNPSASISNIDITSKISETATIFVYNTLGQLMIHQVVNMNIGYNHFVLDTKDLSSGMYNVLIVSETTKAAQKLQIAK